jgi:hypothetical protein
MWYTVIEVSGEFAASIITIGDRAACSPKLGNDLKEYTASHPRSE